MNLAPGPWPVEHARKNALVSRPAILSTYYVVRPAGAAHAVDVPGSFARHAEETQPAFSPCPSPAARRRAAHLGPIRHARHPCRSPSVPTKSRQPRAAGGGEAKSCFSKRLRRQHPVVLDVERGRSTRARRSASANLNPHRQERIEIELELCAARRRPFRAAVQCAIVVVLSLSGASSPTGEGLHSQWLPLGSSLLKIHDQSCSPGASALAGGSHSVCPPGGSAWPLGRSGRVAMAGARRASARAHPEHCR